MSHQFQKTNLKPWEIELVNKFPLIFLEKSPDVLCYTKDLPDDARVNLRFGFEHGAGWSKLISELAQTGTELVTHLRAQGIDASIHGFICKEKFGHLTWQGNSKLPPFFQKLWYSYVSGIESQSSHTCEVTGEYGTTYRLKNGKPSWNRTLCKEEAQKQGYDPIP
jgi:hypothetical protein